METQRDRSGGGGDELDFLYLDVCVEGLKKYPFCVTKHTHNEGIFHIIHTHILYLLVEYNHGFHSIFRNFRI